MDYEEWIKRECRYRSRILAGALGIQETKVYPVCYECGEVCLCHEQTCTSCNSANLIEERLEYFEKEIPGRIRCLYRFELLAKGILSI